MDEEKDTSLFKESRKLAFTRPLTGYYRFFIAKQIDSSRKSHD
jgi:hypothetical protein